MTSPIVRIGEADGGDDGQEVHDEQVGQGEGPPPAPKRS
jgi:hypothetical protein